MSPLVLMPAMGAPCFFKTALIFTNSGCGFCDFFTILHSVSPFLPVLKTVVLMTYHPHLVAGVLCTKATVVNGYTTVVVDFLDPPGCTESTNVISDLEGAHHGFT